MNESEVREFIQAKNRAVERWYASGEIDRLVEVFAEDVWQMPPNSPPLVGRDALRDFWSQAVAWGDWSFTLDTQEVVLSPPIAVERGKYRLQFRAGPDAPPNMSSFHDHGNYVVLWRREKDDEWRIVWDAPVSEVAAPTANAGRSDSP